MPDENTPQDDGQQNGQQQGNQQQRTNSAEGLTPAQMMARIGELERRTQSLNTDLEAARRQASTLQQERDNLNGQLQERVNAAAALQTQYDTAQSNIARLTQELSSAQSTVSSAQQELTAFKTVASDPKYHGIIDMLDTIQLPDDPEQMTAVLDRWADKFSNVSEAAAKAEVESFRAGGTPPAGNGGDNNASPGTSNTTPQTYDQAIQAAHQLVQSGQYNQAQLDGLLNLAQQFQEEGKVS